MADQTESPAGDSRGRLHRFADWLDAWHVTRIFNAISAFAIILAVVAFSIDIVGRTEERIARAWQLVTTKAPGNSGKIQALEYLNSEDWWWPFKRQVPLVGIDLSWDPSKGPRVYLEGVELSGARLTGADLSSANLTNADLSGADLRHANLTAAWIVGANLDGAFLWRADLNGTILLKTNLSGAELRGAQNLTQDQLDSAWAWRLDPPKDLPDGMDMTRLCDGTQEEIRSFYADPADPRVPPGC